LSDQQSSAALPEEYQQLKKIKSEFDQFLSVVLDDLKIKLENLRKYKSSESSSLQDKNYAALQIFMLQKYSNRIQNFKTVSLQSVEQICQAHREANPYKKEAAPQLVEKYSLILEKMKRRLKHMIDVSEKYAVVEIFDTIHILDEASKDLNCSAKSNQRSVMSLENDILDCTTLSIHDCSRKSSETSTSSKSFSGPPSDEKTRGKTKTLRSLSDHLCVLRKTYMT